MKKWLLITTLLLSSLAFADESGVREEVDTKKTMGFVKFGVTIPDTEVNSGNSDTELFADLELVGRYAFTDKVGVGLGIGKWFGEESDITNPVGGLSYQSNLFLAIALSGSLTDQTKVTTIVSSHEVEKNGKNLITTTLTRTIEKNKFDGFRLNLSVGEYTYSRIEEPLIGGGASLFYEQRLENNYLQFGVKGDFMQNENVKASLYQGFVGLGF